MISIKANFKINELLPMTMLPTCDIDRDWSGVSVPEQFNYPVYRIAPTHVRECVQINQLLLSRSQQILVKRNKVYRFVKAQDILNTDALWTVGEDEAVEAIRFHSNGVWESYRVISCMPAVIATHMFLTGVDIPC